ncbi:MAG TPA: hypothetical protein PK228_02675 [Saprospiraceae bacterium]|nr:hypothetical protein [Saprospiraceae bacterium]
MENKGPFYGQIEAFLTGRLEPGEQEAMLEAIREDPELAREIELRRLEFDVSESLIADNVRQQMQRLRTESPPLKKSPPGSRRRLLLLLIAVILLSTAIGIYRWNMPVPQLPTSPPPGQTIDPAPPSVPAPQAAGAEEDGKKAPQKPDEQKSRYLTLANELYQNPDFETLRGAASGPADSFETALSAWQKQDYKAVISSLRSIETNDPKYWRAMTLRAHAQFKLNQFRQAAQSFAAIADGKIQPWAEDAEGYLLLAMLADGQTGTAAFRARLDKVLSDTGHPWFEQAKTVQSKL